MKGEVEEDVERGCGNEAMMRSPDMAVGGGAWVGFFNGGWEGEEGPPSRGLLSGIVEYGRLIAQLLLLRGIQQAAKRGMADILIGTVFISV